MDLQSPIQPVNPLDLKMGQLEFLAGLDRELNEVRRRILGRRPMSITREVFAKVLHEELTGEDEVREPLSALIS